MDLLYKAKKSGDPGEAWKALDFIWETNILVTALDDVLKRKDDYEGLYGPSMEALSIENAIITRNL